MHGTHTSLASGIKFHQLHLSVQWVLLSRSQHQQCPVSVFVCHHQAIRNTRCDHIPTYNNLCLTTVNNFHPFASMTYIVACHWLAQPHRSHRKFSQFSPPLRSIGTIGIDIMRLWLIWRFLCIMERRHKHHQNIASYLVVEWMGKEIKAKNTQTMRDRTGEIQHEITNLQCVSD